MKNAPVVTFLLFGALVLSGVLMFKSGFRSKVVDERAVLVQWPQEVAKALDDYDLDKMADYFTNEFRDQDGTTKETFKALLALERPQSTHWKAIIKSTQVDWDPLVALDAELQIHFELVKFGDPKSFDADLSLKKIDDEWKGVSVTIKRSEFTAPDSKAVPPK